MCHKGWPLFRLCSVFILFYLKKTGTAFPFPPENLLWPTCVRVKWSQAAVRLVRSGHCYFLTAYKHLDWLLINRTLLDVIFLLLVGLLLDDFK